MSSGTIQLHTRKRLWVRSGGICAHPDCDEHLIEATADAQDDTIVGIECHIIARKDDPRIARAVSTLNDDERARYAALVDDRHGFDNLVLMCAKHSRVVDDPVQGYSVERMLAIKRDHEADMTRRRTPQERRDDQAMLTYTAIVDEWAKRVALDNWDRLMSPLVGDGHPRLSIEHFEALGDARSWLFERVWPGTEPELEQAFENFRLVLEDLQRVLEFHPHEVLRDSGMVAIARFYNDGRYWQRPDVDHALLDRWYDYYSSLVEDLAFELTRATNLICDIVRRRLDPRYRMDEGVATITEGPFMDFSWSRLRPHYAPGSGGSPYEGLREFLTARRGRDIVRGQGQPPEGLTLPGDGLPGG